MPDSSTPTGTADDSIVITQMIPLRVGLTRKHFRRLRWYFMGNNHPATGRPDPIDLDLLGVGLIERVPNPRSEPKFVLTKAGDQELALEHLREIGRRAGHHDFGSRLAGWLRQQGRMTWENIEFKVTSPDVVTIPGTAMEVPDWVSIVRPDVFSLAKSYNPDRMNPCIHEVKVSREDFLADLAKPEKRRGYTHLSEVFYYACPEGLIQLEEVPIGCGLVYEIEPGHFEVKKKPKKRKMVLSPRHFMNLILKPGNLNRF
ncbi:hypothetical protein SGO26_29940 (plasmid) [Cupriavidus metallidurans]|nr:MULTISPECIES: hypothetical protein [Cupriavidus]GMG94765.1 hypothetical protein Cmtc_59850 [Cupriavidus sp. TKC]